MAAQPKPRDRPAATNLRASIGIAYRVEEAARMVGLSKATIWRRIKEGRIQVKREGKAPLILHSDLEAYMNALPYDNKNVAQ